MRNGERKQERVRDKYYCTTEPVLPSCSLVTDFSQIRALHYCMSSVGIATGYGLEGPGIESRWRRDFPHLSRPALGPTQPPVQWAPGLSRGVESGRGVTLTPHSLLVQRSNNRIELYLYSP
jgi:hypothetical protein